jgi:hypothetical protein
MSTNEVSSRHHMTSQMTRPLHKESDLLPDYAAYDENAKYIIKNSASSKNIQQHLHQQPIITKRHLASSSTNAMNYEKSSNEFSTKISAATNINRKIASGAGMTKSTKLNGIVFYFILPYISVFRGKF